jgi:transposase
MRAYSEDLHRKIVEATQRGMSKAQATRLFGVSLSSVKRYARIAHRGDSLTPKKGSGRSPKANKNIEKLLEEDIKQRPAASVSERRRFLGHITGRNLSDSTVRRLLKRMGFSRKKELWGRWNGTSS